MKSLQQPISAIRVSVQACLLVIALSSVTDARAVAAPTKTEVSPAAVKAEKKLELHTHLEKLRALREERERAADRAAAVEAASPQPLAASVSRAPVAAQPSVRLGRDAERAIKAAVHYLGLSPKNGAGAAGFLVGVTGPWAQSKFIEVSAAENVVLEVLSQGAADAGAGFLADRFAVAERTGRMARYLSFALLAGGLLYAAYSRFSQRSARASRRNSYSARKPAVLSNNSNNTGIGMFKIFNRKPAKSSDKQEPGQAVVVAFDMDTLRDYAYNLLFARGRHDLAGVGDMVTPNFARCLQTHFQTLEAKGHWNKVERVCAINCQEVESWQEAEISIAKLHVSWKALDYIVNFNRRPSEPGYVVDGDPSKMEEFYEEWVVTRRAGEAWQVDAMYPASRPSTLTR